MNNEQRHNERQFLRVHEWHHITYDRTERQIWQRNTDISQLIVNSVKQNIILQQIVGLNKNAKKCECSNPEIVKMEEKHRKLRIECHEKADNA